MKIVNEVTISSPYGSSHSAILDLSCDIILNFEDVLKAIYAYKNDNIYEPRGVWLNLNQCYELAKEQVKLTGRENEDKLEDLAHNLKSVGGVSIFLKGRDAL